MAAAGFTTDANGVIRDATGAIIGADPSAINTNAFTPVAAQTSSASGTDALTAGLLKGVSNVLANPATGTALANAAGAGLTAVENAFGIQTPQQQAAAAQAAAQQQQQQQQTMLIVGGVIVAVILIGVTLYVVRKK
jgi:hypothetical protein